MRTGFCALLLAAGLPLAAQENFPHHNFSLAVGAAHPIGEISSFMKTAPQVGIDYGYRFHRYFQADTGVNFFFGAGSVRDFLNTQVGTFQVKDREYMIPLGGRGILPLAGGRLLLAAGGGAVWLKYSERLNTGNLSALGISLNCDTCTTRSGWGGYGLLSGSYFLDSGQHFRVGVTSRFIRAHTDGEPLGTIPGVRTSDRWVNITAELGFSF